MLVFGSPVFGEDGNGEGERLDAQWRALDANGDGVVSLEELHPLQAAAMMYRDLDRDGIISLEEYKACDRDRDRGGAGRVPPGGEMSSSWRTLPMPARTILVSAWMCIFPNSPPLAGDRLCPRRRLAHGQQGDGPIPGDGAGRQRPLRGGIHRLPPHPGPHRTTISGRVFAGYTATRTITVYASRICAMGASAGGQLVAHLGTSAGERDVEDTLGDHLDQTSEVQCVINFFGLRISLLTA